MTPAVWEQQRHYAEAAAAFYGLTMAAFILTTTEFALAAIRASEPSRPKLRLVALYGRRIDHD